MRFNLVAHRGYSEAYPENTLESVGAAIECGATAVEFDIQLTADHVPVVCHDDSLKRTGETRQSILDSRYAEIEGAVVGESRRFGDRFEGVRLPSLAQMVERLLSYPRVTVFAEIKLETMQRFDFEAVTASILPVLAPLQGRCVLISDDLDGLLHLREQGDFPIGWIIHRWTTKDRQQAESATPDYLVVNHKYLPDVTEPLWPGPWQWVVYHTDDPDKARSLNNMGVEYVETNDICPMLEVLGGELVP
ncbi:MAG: hypothetical protein HUJ29_00995 [Gammaproteobacteria bacterium]|nr:hypothetical protein [Gammaproteobacteria bacterium]